MKLVTANLFDFNKDPATQERQDEQVAYLRAQNADVLSIQEFWHETSDPADPALAAAFTRFCDELGMQGRLAYARSYCHVGVLWNPATAGVRNWQTFGKWPFHHALGVLTLDVGDSTPWRVATTQLSPASPEARSTEAALVAMAGLGNPKMVTFVGMDTNTPGTEPALDGSGPYYDPEPYENQPPGQPHHLYQVKWNDNPDAPPIVDRRAAEKLRRAGLTDVAWHLRAPWTPTTGHHPADPHGPRRIDNWRASAAGLERVESIRVLPTEQSDHYGVEITATKPN
jgi:hypothetical protein